MRGSLIPAEVPLIDAEILFKESGPPLIPTPGFGVAAEFFTAMMACATDFLPLGTRISIFPGSDLSKKWLLTPRRSASSFLRGRMIKWRLMEGSL
jgi:hypothetical protein